jgi:hypothetical protein
MRPGAPTTSISASHAFNFCGEAKRRASVGQSVERGVAGDCRWEKRAGEEHRSDRALACAIDSTATFRLHVTKTLSPFGTLCVTTWYIVVLFPVPGGPWIFSSALDKAQTAFFCDAFARGAPSPEINAKSSSGRGAGPHDPGTSSVGRITARRTGDAACPRASLWASSVSAASSATNAPTYPNVRI